MSKVDITQYPNTVEAFGGNEQRATVFLDRYALKGKDGKPRERTPEEMWGRVAAAMALDEEDVPRSEDYNAYFSLLKDFKFVPGGRILSGAGVDADVTFYNCYVIPVETKTRRQLRAANAEGLRELETGCDSREAIIDTIGLMVDIMSRGGGVGVNWSVLRPSGAYLKSINATSSGPIDWMHLASTAVGTVEQGGSRRGAAMFMLDDWHPDVLKFIDAKREAGRITNANISVAVSDEFMKAVAEDADWDLVFPDTSDRQYDEAWDGDIRKWEDPGRPVKVYQTIKARDLWKKLTDAAHASGEPGVVFLGRYNEQSTAKGVERIICVNPCGEQGLGAYSVCNLGAMNLAAYFRPHIVKRDTRPNGDYRENDNGGPYFDWPAFKRDVKTAVRFMDRAIDVNKYFIPENERVQKNLRRIGLSVMGLADVLILLGFRYGSPQAVEFTEAVFREMKHAAIAESVELAKEFGPAPAWTKEMQFRPYLADIPKELARQVDAYGLRNLFLLTQAPTGTTSILADVNSGIEPLFDLGYWREDRTGKHWVQPATLCDLSRSPEMRSQEGKTWDTVAWPDYVVTASDVTVEEHIAMQAAVQKYVDSSVSKTINAPNSQTAEETAKAYQLAYDSGLKGLAYYRDKSRDEQVLSRDEKTTNEPVGTYKDSYVETLITALEQAEQARVDAVLKAPEEFVRGGVLAGKTRKVPSRHGSVYVTVNYDENAKPVEVFFSAGKSGEEVMLMAEAMGRLASLALRKGATLGGVANQLEGIGGQTKIAFQKSLPHAIGEALSAENKDDRAIYVKYNPEAEMPTTTVVSAPVSEPEPTSATMSHKPTGQLCPDCGQHAVAIVEGCKKCRDCGWSAC